MLASQAPTSFVAPFANAAGAGFIRTIPVASQIGITAGAASLQDGFPPVTFVPVAAGGTPPFGQDTNGILYQATAGVQWSQVGGEPVYNSTFSTAIGGYPNGAILQSADGTGFWRSTADNNETNPDTGGAGWVPMFFSTSASIALTNANVALTAAQYSKPIIVLTGTLTGNVVLTFPALTQQWAVINSTSGAFSVTAVSSGGVSVTLTQGCKTVLRGNGTNVVIDEISAPAINTPVLQSSSTGLVIQSDGAVSAKNASGTGFVQMLAAAATTANSAVVLGQFLAALGSSGFFEVPVMVSGVLFTMVVQFGTVTQITAGSGTTNVAYALPTTFPNNFLFALAGYGGTTPPVSGGSVSGQPLTQSTIEISTFTPAAQSIAVNYIAIGF